MTLTATISPVSTITARRPIVTATTKELSTPTLSKIATLQTTKQYITTTSPSTSSPKTNLASPSSNTTTTSSTSGSFPCHKSCPTKLDARTTSDRDFSWSNADEPHAIRRREIMAKYPEISQLFGVEPLTFPIVVLIFVTQVFFAYLVSSLSLSWPVLIALAWAVGGTLNHSLQLAVHELSHNLCWNNPLANKWTAIFANLVTGFPSSVSFQKYHMDHHQWQGVDGIDTDIPTKAEVAVFSSSLRKVLWLLLQPVFYALRPTIVKPKTFTKWEFTNGLIQILFNVAIAYFLGMKGLAYLLSGTVLGLGLHPAAGHFVAEHYELVTGQETYSYYGPCNYVNFNVGYHNEHHDFPRIPWSRLPLVSKIAPEYYTTLPHYTSYLALLWAYITNSKLGPHARIKRASNSKSAASGFTAGGVNVIECAKQKNRMNKWSVAIALGIWFCVCVGYVTYHVIHS